MINVEKSTFAIQPYKVGSKNSNTLAMIIPSKVTRRYNIDESTILILKLADSEKKLVFDIVSETKTIKDMIPADESFQASGQQVSREIH